MIRYKHGDLQVLKRLKRTPEDLLVLMVAKAKIGMMRLEILGLSASMYLWLGYVLILISHHWQQLVKKGRCHSAMARGAI